VNSTPAVVRFARADCYTTVSRNVSSGTEIARLTVDYPARDCLYKIHSVERIQSKDLFRIDPHSGSILIAHSLENSLDEKHLLSVIYHCANHSQLAHTRLHITLRKSETADNRSMELYRFAQEHYLVLFETSPSVNQTKALLNLTLISCNDDGRRTKPNAHIIKGRYHVLQHLIR
jgi:hypothetical protein